MRRAQLPALNELDGAALPAMPVHADRTDLRDRRVPAAVMGLLSLCVLSLPSVASAAYAEQGGSLSLGVRYPTALGAFGLELDTSRNVAFGVGLGVNPNQTFVVSAFGKLFAASTQAGPYLSARFDTRSFEENFVFGLVGYRADLFNSFVDLEAGFGRRLGGRGDGGSPFTVGAQVGMRF